MLQEAHEDLQHQIGQKYHVLQVLMRQPHFQQIHFKQSYSPGGSRQSGTRSVAGVGAVETEAEAGEWLSNRAPFGEREPEDKHDDLMVVMPCSDGGSTTGKGRE
jgi:hypothetical protein